MTIIFLNYEKFYLRTAGFVGGFVNHESGQEKEIIYIL